MFGERVQKSNPQSDTQISLSPLSPLSISKTPLSLSTLSKTLSPLHRSPLASEMTAVALPTASAGRELSNPPTDGISNLRFSNTSDHLLVSSWDKVFHLIFLWFCFQFGVESHFVKTQRLCSRMFEILCCDAVVRVFDCMMRAKMF